MSAPVTVIDPDDANRCAVALQYTLRRWPKGLDRGDLQQIQAVFHVAGQTGQTLQIGPLQSRVSHDGTPTHDVDDDLLNIIEAAEVDGVSRRTIQRRVDRGDLHPVIVGGRRFIRRADLNREGSP